MTLDECLRIARECGAWQPKLSPEACISFTAEKLLAFARKVEAEAIRALITGGSQNGN